MPPQKTNKICKKLTRLSVGIRFLENMNIEIYSKKLQNIWEKIVFQHNKKLKN